MNQVQIMGNLARDAETRFTKTGKMVVTFTVAASTFYMANNEQKENVAYINCVAWGKLAEGVGRLLKGNRVFLTGRLSTRSYETNDGQKRYITEVVADFVGDSFSNGHANTQSNFDSFGHDAAAVPEEEIPF